jgi:hypothetical protein
MFDEKLYSNTVVNSEASIRRAETAINSANSNVVKWGHSVVRAFCRQMARGCQRSKMNSS